MRLKYLLLLATIFIMPLTATAAYAEIIADTDSVRLMLTAPDNQDLSAFERDSLIETLVEIALNDPESAEYHDRVVTSALIHLGTMHAYEAVDVLIARLPDYPTTCLFWLGTYGSQDALDAIIPYLFDEDASVRYEAASALGTIPLSADVMADGMAEDTAMAYDETLREAFSALLSRVCESEEDADVRVAIMSAIEHITPAL